MSRLLTAETQLKRIPARERLRCISEKSQMRSQVTYQVHEYPASIVVAMLSHREWDIAPGADLQEYTEQLQSIFGERLSVGQIRETVINLRSGPATNLLERATAAICEALSSDNHTVSDGTSCESTHNLRPGKYNLRLLSSPAHSCSFRRNMTGIMSLMR